MIPNVLVKSKQQIIEVCKKYQISELSLFGSQVRGDFNETSDFDFLVDFLPEAEIGFFELTRIQSELEKIVMTNVDLVTKKGLKEFIRPTVLADAEILYAT
jgi:uncharacterized protein